MMLAVPGSVTVLSPVVSDRVVLDVSGQTEEGVAQACRPSIVRLAEFRRSRRDDGTLGVLLSAVAGTAGGHARAVGADNIELHFKGETD